MRNSILFFLTILSISTLGQPGAGWNIIFEDEFEGNTLDQSKWNYHYTWGHTHNHRAYMDEDQVVVADGKLKLTAIDQRHPDAPDGTDQWYDQFGYIPFDYTSGAVNTNGKFNFTYGYVEGRFKMSGHGTWPAFWTLNGTGEWPPEIDILECPHDRTNHHFYYHYGPDWQNEASFGGQHNGVDKSLDFHTYGVEWGPDYMHFYFDGQRVSTNSGRDCTQGNNMYLIINLAVGGWSGDPSPSDVFPTTYECDWVRVWQRDLNTGNWGLEDGELGLWGQWNDVSVSNSCSHSGDYGLQLVGSPASSERLVEVEPNTTYIFGGWGRIDNTGNYTVIGVKNYGGNELRQQFTSTEWEEKEIIFTTGATTTTARIYFYQSEGTGTSCGDDFYLIEATSDCNGDIGGSAYTDYCGNCVEGNTGHPPCAAEVLQAEDACSFDGIEETNFSGFEGESFVNINMETGAQISFDIYCETVAQVGLAIRYANGATDDRDCQLQINDIIENVSISFPPTGDWSNWENSITQIYLSAGRNTITLSANQVSGAANFDLFAITGDITFMSCNDQTIDLEQGWNLISTYLDINDYPIATIFPNASIIKNEDTFYSDNQPQFLNTLINIEAGEAYWVYNSIAEQITLNGDIINNTTSDIPFGWSMIGVPSNTPIPVTDLPSDIIIIKGIDSFYQPSDNSGTITELEPGHGYLLLR